MSKKSMNITKYPTNFVKLYAVEKRFPVFSKVFETPKIPNLYEGALIVTSAALLVDSFGCQNNGLVALEVIADKSTVT